MWDPPKPVSPALAGGFLTTGPPGKSRNSQESHEYCNQSPLTFGNEALPKILLQEDLIELLPEINSVPAPPRAHGGLNAALSQLTGLTVNFPMLKVFP